MHTILGGLKKLTTLEIGSIYSTKKTCPVSKKFRKLQIQKFVDLQLFYIRGSFSKCDNLRICDLRIRFLESVEVSLSQIIIHASKKAKVLFHIDKVMVGFVSHLTSASMI